MKGTRSFAQWSRIIGQILLFLLAIVVFYIGLFLGLQVDPQLGTLMWVTSAAIIALDLYWIHRSRRNSGHR